MKMKRNTLNKIADWIEKFKVWISNKKPSNKYLRIAYYFLTGLISFMLTIPLAIFIFVVIIALILLLIHLIVNFSFVRIIMTLLVCLMFLIAFSLIGYFEFGDD